MSKQKPCKPRRPNLLRGKTEKLIKDILSDPALALGAGLLIGGIIIGGKLDLSRKCTHPEPVPCPRDASGKLTDPKCQHYGHVPGMCHVCYCLRCTCCSPVAGHCCPPSCPPNRFDGCHRRDCLKDCAAAWGEPEIMGPSGDVATFK